jgi:hypothetical protein
MILRNDLGCFAFFLFVLDVVGAMVRALGGRLVLSEEKKGADAGGRQSFCFDHLWFQSQPVGLILHRYRFLHLATTGLGFDRDQHPGIQPSEPVVSRHASPHHSIPYQMYGPRSIVLGWIHRGLLRGMRWRELEEFEKGWLHQTIAVPIRMKVEKMSVADGEVPGRSEILMGVGGLELGALCAFPGNTSSPVVTRRGHIQDRPKQRNLV